MEVSDSSDLLKEGAKAGASIIITSFINPALGAANLVYQVGKLAMIAFAGDEGTKAGEFVDTVINAHDAAQK